MKPQNLVLRRRLAYIESQLEAESMSNRHSPRFQEERRHRLTEEKIVIQESLDSTVYPILTIPFEVTAEIFVHCLPEFPGRSGTVAPMLLTRVCRQWRNIACNNARLWTALGINVWSNPQPDFIFFVREWLRLGRAALSSLHLTLPYYHWPSSSLLKTLPLTTAHWHHLTSFRGTRFVPSECLGLLSRAPRLTHCTFDDTPWRVPDSRPVSTPKILLENLQHLQLTAHSVTPFNFNPLLLVLESLTSPALRSLTITGPFRDFTASILPSFLRRSPNLQTLDVVSFCTDWILNPTYSTTYFTNTLIATPSLTSLRLHVELTLIFDILRLLADSTFLPHVQTISARASGEVYWTPARIQIFVDAVTSRWEGDLGVAQLVDFELLLDHVPSQIDACVLELKGRGMRIRAGR
ncbi:hypothetical protein C8R46DRAFT_941056 [Mycena filopes]|nr:hypothetical protein C8R46DRAFT_941056 [Mycena filopes]